MKKILVVDDEEAILDICERWLERWGYEVTTALGGIKALPLLEKEKYALVICDTKMPEVSGLHVFKKVKEKSPDIPFILISGFSEDDQEVKNILELGVYHYLYKPIKFTHLKEIIKEALGE